MKIYCPTDQSHTQFHDDRFGTFSTTIPVYSADGKRSTMSIPENFLAIMGEQFVPICVTCGASAVIDRATTP